MYDIKNIDQVEKILGENKINIEDNWIFHNFWRKVDIKDNINECWNWIGSINTYGYGNFRYCDKIEKSHRIAYTLSRGNIPNGLDVLHICNNPTCNNPKHLEIGDHYKNMQYKVKCRRHSGGNYKLTEDQVREIHILYNKELRQYSNIKQWQITEPIAKKFGTTANYVNDIISGRCWKHIFQEMKTMRKQ
jgi:hypothetical protein